MQIIMIAYVVALFMALTPGVLLRIPKGGSKLTVAVVHGLVFAVLYCLTYGFVSRTLYADGFQSSGGGVSMKVMNARARADDLQNKAMQAKLDTSAARSAVGAAESAVQTAMQAERAAFAAAEQARAELVNLEQEERRAAEEAARRARVEAVDRATAAAAAARRAAGVNKPIVNKRGYVPPPQNTRAYAPPRTAVADDAVSS